MMIPTDLLLAYYGDDFTGSTDALEFLSRAGIKTALFIEPPTPEQLQRYSGLQAIGVAGSSRSMTPLEMEQELRPAFHVLKRLGARHVHYKVCSTFDSSPTIGSIGRAIDIGADVFAARFVPLLVAAPALGRYCVFGNLFARMGIGSKGEIYRLDRHPSMIKHPTTPADESDLRIHLARQTSKAIGLVDILQITLPFEEAKKAMDNGAEVILFDGLYEHQMAGIGQLIDASAEAGKSLFSVGSSGVEMALGNYWIQNGQLQPINKWPSAGKVDAILVASGSRSPVSAAQIAWAVAKGFLEIALDTSSLAQDEDAEELIETYIAAASLAISNGQSVIIHTSNGENDQRAAEAKNILAAKGMNEQEIKAATAKIFGTALGTIIKNVASRSPIQRIVVAGGDTSSYAARAMGIEAVEMITTLSPGAPLCRAHAPGSPVDSLELNFKGGQVGREDYFEMVRSGTFSE